MKTQIFTERRKKERRCIERVYGDCLEKIGLRFTDGKGYAVVDSTVTPRVGDIVHCDNRFGTIHGFIKQVKEIKDGIYIVGTAYENSEKDYTFEASIIYGVVTMVFDGFDRRELYNRAVTKIDKIGTWKKRGNEKCCSECGFIYYSNNDDFNFCPNCGDVKNVEVIRKNDKQVN